MRGDSFKPYLKHIREFSWLAVLQLLTLPIGFITIKVLAIMGPTEYGKYALSISILTFMGMLFFYPFDQALTRYFYDIKLKGLQVMFLAFIKTVLLRVNGVIILIASIGCIAFYFYSGNSLTNYYIFISIIFAAVASSSSLLQSMLNIARKRKAFFYFSIIDRSSKIALLLLLLQIGFLNASTVLSVYLFTVVLILFAEWNYLKSKIFTLANENTLTFSLLELQEFKKKILNFSKPLLIFGLLSWTQTNAERWIIQLIMDTSNVGIYAFMVAIANTILTISITAIGQFVNPIIIEKFSDLRNETKVQQGLKYIRYFIFGIVCITFVMVIFSYYWKESILVLLGNEKFVPYSSLLPFVFLGIGLVNLGQTLCLVGFVLQKTEKYILPKIILAVLVISLEATGAKYYGLDGVAIATILTGLIYLFLVLTVNKKIMLTLYRENNM